MYTTSNHRKLTNEYRDDGREGKEFPQSSRFYESVITVDRFKISNIFIELFLTHILYRADKSRDNNKCSKLRSM